MNIILDEMNNIGIIPDFGRRLSTVRSRALQILMACQSLPQLQNRYPNNLWAELVGNADTQLMLGCTDDVSAEYFSSRSGDMTVEVNSTMTTRQSIAMAQVIPQYRYSEGLGRRRLLTPDEVLRLPNNELLIIIRGQKVLRARKFDYTGHPFAKDCVKASILDYKSNHSPPPEPEIVQAEPAAAEETQSKANPQNQTIPARPHRLRRILRKRARPNPMTRSINRHRRRRHRLRPHHRRTRKHPKNQRGDQRTLYESSRPPMDF